MRRTWTEETREQIVRNPLNDSTSKSSWSFSKGARFSTQKSVCPFVAYQSNESKVSSRKTSFGYGKRLNFILENKFTPGPDTYSLPTEQFKKSCFLADSRDKVVSSSYISRERLKIPGPGQYRYSQFKNHQSQSYTMRPKTPYQKTYFIHNRQTEPLPGPGRYDIGSITVGIDSSVVSKYKNNGVPNLNARTSKRFTTGNKNPGPGDYFNSRNPLKESPYSNKSIGRQTRTSFTQEAARRSLGPGPGRYKLPTDFGHYGRISGDC